MSAPAGTDDDPNGIAHLPYASATLAGDRPHLYVRIGDQALDLTEASAGTRWEPVFADGNLDRLLAAGRPQWSAARAQIVDWLTGDRAADRPARHLVPVGALRLRLPFTVADYADFYASEQHATNVGRIFRPDADPLPPNWKYLPIGYHGRAGTVVVSGTDVRRPWGQSRDTAEVTFAPSRRLDFEAEVAFVVGTPSQLGSAVGVSQFREHAFGVVLLDDWSARDIQAWEYVPLGPFLGKSFATSISGWVTPLDALEDAWTVPGPRDPRPFDHLDDGASPAALDLRLNVAINGATVSRPPFASMYWTFPQLLAHLTSNGASVRTGDLVASGTVSGPGPDELGCLLELTRNGAEPLTLDDDSARTYLQDGDEVVLTATAPGRHGPIELGEVRGRIVAARPGGR